uniref:B9 domain-containing protein 1 n=1 Tax=Trypanosoma congolense (strain IL3000) TaxID=1068625 RepID=G0UYI5_TRYCI|nr:unnamed protein product [Trypanosoma congolense IL3000]
MDDCARFTTNNESAPHLREQTGESEFGEEIHRQCHRTGPPHSACRASYPQSLPPLRSVAASPLRATGFDVVVQGVLEGAVCHEADALFARTYWVYGVDWTAHGTHNRQEAGVRDTALVHPLGQRCQSEVITQLSVVSDDPFARFTWGAPFECSLRSTNPYGWPQLVVTLHTVSGSVHLRGASNQDSLAASGSGERCVAYSRCFVPTCGGTYRKKLPLLQMKPSTSKQSLVSWLVGQQPELRDPAFLCTGEDRCVLTAAPLTGHVSLTLSITISGLRECGIGS